MTIANNYVPIRQIGNGVLTQVSAAWSMLSSANSVVQLQDAVTGVLTPVTQGAGAGQYQIVITSSGFTVTMGTAWTASQYLLVSRSTPLAQIVPYKTSTGFSGPTEEASFDALTAMQQEAANTFARCISVQIGDTATNLVLPIASARALLLLGFDASGNVTVTAGTPGPAGPSYPYAAAGGTVDAITATFSPAIAFTAGATVALKLAGANATTTPTLNGNATGVKTITKKGGTALAVGDLPGANAVAIMTPDTVNNRWELLNPAGAATAAAGAGYKNVIIGGDFTTNPWQRGTSAAVAGGTAITYNADRWFTWIEAGAGTAATAQQNAATTLANFPYSLQLQRTAANAAVWIHHLAQIIESWNCYALQGQQVTLSFYARAGANFSAASNNLKVRLITGTLADEGAVALTGGWSSQATPINATQAITTSWVKYTFTGTVGATVKEMCVDFNFTPVGSAGAADLFEIAGVQLEAGSSASSFENLPPDVVLSRCLRYFYSAIGPAQQYSRTAAGIGFSWTGLTTSSATVQEVFAPMPVTMRAIPSMSTPASYGGYKARFNGGAGNTVTSISVAGSYQPDAQSTVVAAVTSTGSPVSGQAVFLYSLGPLTLANALTFSAEL